MAPAKKKQRVQVVESELLASEGQENRSSACVLPPVSILKDTIANFPSVKSLPRTEELNLRRKTYFIHGADVSEENEPCVIDDAQVTTSSTVDNKIRRLTYIVTPVPEGHAESLLMNCNPGVEMNQSEMEIAGIQLQPSTVQDSKSKKRVGKKKSIQALQEGPKVMESENADHKKPSTVQDSKSKKRVGKKKSIQALQEDSKVMESENADHKKEYESLISKAPAGGKPRKRGQKKSANSNDAQVKSQESENGTEISTVKAKDRRKKAQQDQESLTIPTGSDVQKKAVKRGKKKNAD